MTTPNADISLSGSSLESTIRNVTIPTKTTRPKITLSNDINLGNRFCRLAMTFPKMSKVKLKSYRCPKFDGDAKQTLEIRVERKRNLKLRKLGEVSFEMLKLGELGEVSFGIFKLGE